MVSIYGSIYDSAQSDMTIYILSIEKNREMVYNNYINDQPYDIRLNRKEITMKRIITLTLCLLMLTAVLAGCGKEVVSSGTTTKTTSDDKKEASTEPAKTNESGDYSMVLSGSITNLSEVPAADLSNINTEYQNAAPKSGDVIAVLHTNHGDIKMRFFPEVAPKAVNNFIALAKAGKYDNTIFHRVIEDFMIQGGDFTNFDGTGGESVYGETFGYEISDYVLNTRGAVAMAHSQLPDSNGSQFYINQKNNNWLDGDYTVFGQVVEGLEVVDEIAAVEKNGETPIEKVTLDSVEITTY